MGRLRRGREESGTGDSALLPETALSTRAVMLNNIGHTRVRLEHS